MLPASASSPLHLDLTAKVKYTPVHNVNALAQALSPDMSHTCKMKGHGPAGTMCRQNFHKFRKCKQGERAKGVLNQTYFDLDRVDLV